MREGVFYLRHGGKVRRFREVGGGGLVQGEVQEVAEHEVAHPPQPGHGLQEFVRLIWSSEAGVALVLLGMLLRFCQRD